MAKVMFVCAAGMSTSLLVEKVNKAAKEKGLELEVYAMGEAEARKDLTQADVLLLGPQVRYLSLRKRLPDQTRKLVWWICCLMDVWTGRQFLNKLSHC